MFLTDLIMNDNLLTYNYVSAPATSIAIFAVRAIFLKKHEACSQYLFKSLD